MARLMTIFAHQDDETFSAGGTVAKYADIGESICVTVTSDEQRRNEFKEACQILGALPVILENNSVTYGNFRDIIDQLIIVIRQHRPDVVITHVDFDYHHEHRIVRKAVEEAVEWVSHTTGSQVAHQVSSLWAAETTVLIPKPEIFVDISNHNYKRILAIQCYESQSHKGGKGFYSKFHNTRTNLRGIQSDVEHAEVFLSVPILLNGSFKPNKVSQDLDFRAGRN